MEVAATVAPPTGPALSADGWRSLCSLRRDDLLRLLPMALSFTGGTTRLFPKLMRQFPNAIFPTVHGVSPKLN